MAEKQMQQAVVTHNGLQATQVEFSLPDPASTAVATIESALEYTARKMHLEDVETVASMLRAGQSSARGYFEYAVARELAEHIGGLDAEVQGVYLYDPEATVDDIVFTELPITLVHLVVWARRKTGALTALLDALDRAVTTEFARRIGNQQTSMLDFQVVDDAEVNSRTGFGAMLAWLHNRPLMVWKR
jgi:hypothetical protein